jgi:hypothetical protein
VTTYDLRNSVSQDSPLEALVAAANAHHQSILEHSRNALREAMDAGDELQWAKNRGVNRGWDAFRQEHYPKIKKRTDVMYRLLARHRARIEEALAIDSDMSVRKALALISALAVDPEMSVREALALIGRRKPRPLKTAEPQLTAELQLLALWPKADAQEKCGCLELDSADEIREYLPPDKCRELADRIAQVEKPKRTARDRELDRRLRQFLNCLNHPDTSNVRQAGIDFINYVNEQGIDIGSLEVRVARADAPANRRKALVPGSLRLVVDNNHPNPPA